MKIQIQLSEYIDLLYRARPSLLNQSFCLITTAQKIAIEAVPGYDKLVKIIQVEELELNDFMNIGLIRQIQLELNGEFYKLFSIESWLREYKEEMARKEYFENERRKLVEIQERKQKAIEKLMLNHGLDEKTAKTLLNDFILTGQMNEIAKWLRLVDLVKD